MYLTQNADSIFTLFNSICFTPYDIISEHDRHIDMKFINYYILQNYSKKALACHKGLRKP